ncbi:hypothetical protein AB837_00606 [bacterium AB1]|nr:hypothetical protein AB837_00606 [bacterium AB1]
MKYKIANKIESHLTQLDNFSQKLYFHSQSLQQEKDDQQITDIIETQRLLDESNSFLRVISCDLKGYKGVYFRHGDDVRFDGYRCSEIINKNDIFRFSQSFDRKQIYMNQRNEKDTQCLLGCEQDIKDILHILDETNLTNTKNILTHVTNFHKNVLNRMREYRGCLNFTQDTLIDFVYPNGVEKK